MKWTPFLAPVRTLYIIGRTVLSRQLLPASIKPDDDRLPRSGDRFNRRDEFSSSRRMLGLGYVGIPSIHTFAQSIARSLP